MSTRARSAGFTLLELIVLMVVFMVALAGILMAVNTSVTRSGDPMFRKQAIAAGESMMEEVMLMSFAAGPGTGSRANFDDIFDYNIFNASPPSSPITTIDNIGIPALSGYKMQVTVVGAAVSTITNVNAALITVTVRDPKGNDYVLTAYKTNY